MVLGFWAWALWAFVREPWAPHGRVGVAALGNSVFRVECICMGVGPRHALLTLCGFGSAPWFGLPVPGRVGSFCGLPGLSVWVGFPFVRPAGSPGPVGFVLWAPGSSACSCWQVLYLVLRVRARGPNSVHLQLGARLTLRVMSRACLYSSGCGWWRKKKKKVFPDLVSGKDRPGLGLVRVCGRAPGESARFGPGPAKLG